MKYFGSSQSLHRVQKADNTSELASSHSQSQEPSTAAFSPTPMHSFGSITVHSSDTPAAFSSKITSISPATPVIQRYTKIGPQRFSHNESYISDETTGQDHLLLVEQHAAVPEPHSLIVQTTNHPHINGKTYDEYQYNPTSNFTNDCLAFAENLARDTDVNSARGELRALDDRPGGTDRIFGHNDAQNVDIATPGQSWAKNEATNPGIKEAYAIARTEMPIDGETPYHIALVIAKDPSDNITLEADASDATRTAPIFDMYDTTPPGTRTDPNSKTFHERYEAIYVSTRTKKGKGKKKKAKTTHNPSTGTLVKRTD